MCAEDAVVLAELVAGDLPAEQALPVFMRRQMPRVELVVRNCSPGSASPGGTGQSRPRRRSCSGW